MILFYIGITIVGLAMGSFVNSLVWRIYTGRSLMARRSICVHCARQLFWWENIPVISFWLLRGRCSTCRGPIPRHYVVVEILGALSFIGVGLASGAGVLAGRNLFLCFFWRGFFVRVGLFFLFPLRGVALGVGAGGFVNMLVLHQHWWWLLQGVLLGGGFFWVQRLVSRGKWVGEGDMYMGMMIGLWLGVPGTLFALWVAYVSGAIVGIFFLSFRQKSSIAQMPLGMFLALGTWVSLLWGDRVLVWLLRLL